MIKLTPERKELVQECQAEIRRLKDAIAHTEQLLEDAYDKLSEKAKLTNSCIYETLCKRDPFGQYSKWNEHSDEYVADVHTPYQVANDAVYRHITASLRREIRSLLHKRVEARKQVHFEQQKIRYLKAQKLQGYLGAIINLVAEGKLSHNDAIHSADIYRLVYCDKQNLPPNADVSRMLKFQKMKRETEILVSEFIAWLVDKEV